MMFTKTYMPAREGTKILVSKLTYHFVECAMTADVDVIPGLERGDLGEAFQRNPDALPPANSFEVVGSCLHDFFGSLGGGNATFGIKAGVLTGA